MTIGTDRMLHLSALEALPFYGIPNVCIRDLIFSEIGTVQFGDMTMKMDARTGFSEVLLTRKARDANELVSLYAALIAHAPARVVLGLGKKVGTDECMDMRCAPPIPSGKRGIELTQPREHCAALECTSHYKFR